MKVLLSFIIILFFSCSNKEKSKTTKKIYIVSKGSWKSDNYIDSTFFKIFKKDNEIIYHYEYPINDSVLSYYLNIGKEIGNNKLLRIYDEKCVLVDTLSFIFNNKKLTVYKYLFDEVNTSDDMTDYYFNEKQGVIYSENLAWNTSKFYNTENLHVLHDLIIKHKGDFKSSFKHNKQLTTEN
jgi:hypothetical protein